MTIMQVTHDSFTDIDGEREKLVAVAFASDRDFTRIHRRISFLMWLVADLRICVWAQR